RARVASCGPYFLACFAISRRCRGLIRCQTSYAVSASPIGPAFRGSFGTRRSSHTGSPSAPGGTFPQTDPHKTVTISRNVPLTLEDCMPVETPSIFRQVIEEHLELK